MRRFNFFTASFCEVPGDLPLKSDELPIGVYLNLDRSLDNAVVVTSSALILKISPGWRYISYRSIVKVVIPIDQGRLADVRHLSPLRHAGLIGGGELAEVAGGAQDSDRHLPQAAARLC